MNPERYANALTAQQRAELLGLLYWSPAPVTTFAEQLLASLDTQVLAYPEQAFDMLLGAVRALAMGSHQSVEQAALAVAYLAHLGALTSAQRADLLAQLQALTLGGEAQP